MIVTRWKLQTLNTKLLITKVIYFYYRGLSFGETRTLDLKFSLASTTKHLWSNRNIESYRNGRSNNQFSFYCS